MTARIAGLVRGVVADWWTFLRSPWRAQLDRDALDIDLMARLHQLEHRVAALERR